MEDYKNIILNTEENIALLTLNRPEVHNALDPQTWAKIRSAIRKCRFDQNVRVVIITGAGG